MNFYLFSKRYDGSGYCDSHKWGVTSIFPPLAASTITLCPISFGSIYSRMYFWSYIKPRQITPQTITFETIKSAQGQRISPRAQELIALNPTAKTLFHELFHLITDPLAIPNDKKERYDLAELLKIPFTIASQNPESYTMAAIAYDYTRKSQPIENKGYIEFFTGYATQG